METVQELIDESAVTEDSAQNKENNMKQTSFKVGKTKRSLKGLGITSIVLLTILSIVALVAYIYIVSPAISLLTNVNALREDTRLIGEALTNRDLVTLEQVMQQTETDIEEMRVAREEKFGWAKNLTWFRINEFYDDSERFLNAGQLSIDALRETSRIVTPFADAAGLRVSEDQVIEEQEGLMEAFQTWVSIMPDVSSEMDSVLVILTDIGEELAPIDTSKYPEEFRGIAVRSNVEFAKNTLTKAEEFGPDIKEALTIFPELLGVGNPVPMRYMVIMQNDKELRATGGFWTNYATFKIQDALLQSDFTSKDFYSIDYAIDVIDAYYDFPDAPAPYAKYLKVERWYARDTNSSPDLPTSIDQFNFYYDLGMQYAPGEIKPVDGIITIDTHVIEEIMRITGPVTVNGITYDANNVVLELERIASLNVTEQINRKGVLGDLMEEMLVNVFESDASVWSQLIEKSVELGIKKHIQGYSTNEQAQALIEKYNLGGRIKDPVDGDYAFVVSSNLGGDKTNWFVSKRVEHTLSQEDGRWVKTVKLTYTYPEPGPEYAPFIKRFRDWVRVYTPAGTELISIEGSEDGTGDGEERNKKYYHAYVELAPTETKELTFKYYLPEGVITGNDYNFLIQKQAGIDSEEHVVNVNGQTTTIELDRDKWFRTKIN